MISQHIRKITLVVSIILHLFLLLSYKSLSSIRIFSPQDEKDIIEQEKRMVFEIIETPADAESEKPPENANLLSDKNSIARDRYLNDDKLTANPYGNGDFDVKNIDQNDPTSENDSEDFSALIDQSNPTQQDYNSSYEDEISSNYYQQPQFSRQALLGKSSQETITKQLNKPQYKNKEFNAEDIGGLSFNTYEWDFAPYMLAMKRKVEKNIFPPPAFTRMGLIQGETVLRFKVMPNGEVIDLEVLNYKGHKSLMETSVKAIQSAAPFNPLPSDFPENYLEVTASFSYYIKRQ